VGTIMPKFADGDQAGRDSASQPSERRIAPRVRIGWWLGFSRQRQVVRDVQVQDVLAVDEHDLRSPGGVECAADERASRLGDLAASDDERVIDKDCPANLFRAGFAFHECALAPSVGRWY